MKKFLIIGFRISPETGKAIYFAIDQQTGEEKLSGFSSIQELKNAAKDTGYKVVDWQIYIFMYFSFNNN